MVKQLDIDSAVKYAHKYWNKRNPEYYDFEFLGGDCTNFVSQCLIAGGAIMNFTPTFGWYYINLNKRSPAFTGVDPFYNFIISNNGVGPFGELIDENDVKIGDIIQLSQNGKFYNHTLFVTKTDKGHIFVTAHTYDSIDRPIESYGAKLIRYLRINGIRT